MGKASSRLEVGGRVHFPVGASYCKEQDTFNSVDIYRNRNGGDASVHIYITMSVCHPNMRAYEDEIQQGGIGLQFLFP